MAVRIWMDTSADMAGLYCGTSGITLSHPRFRSDLVTGETAEQVAEAFLSWHRDRWPYFDVRAYSLIQLAGRIGEFKAWRDEGRRVVGQRDPRPVPEALRRGGGGA